ncbi:hypothetical protein CFC21_004701 [Triticum aestivum]|uniref:AAA+ ATPase domain-containing protein n=2 Tax=Triticum aestivum TaxID=4565 RepID=A0A3B5YPY9_WHEAT|nr:uncharacterized protein LOC123102918 [Triticum aestivum]KAF6987030.1 hypothetical protein CFC21_004701 [Triticum aestivum]
MEEKKPGGDGENSMELPPISASLGAMGSISGKLDALQDTEHKDEIRKLRSRLLALSKARDPPVTARIWMKDVRELSYDMDNFVDTDAEWIHKMSGFKARAKDANGRYDRYNLESVPSRMNIATIPMVDAGRKTDMVVGLDGEGGAFKTICNTLADGDEQLKVLSVVGVGGIGKTTLAKQLWREHKLGDHFRCRAFVRTAKKPDMRRVLRSILAQVRPDQPPDASEVHDLIHDLTQHLQDKRYFIIIDDLWHTSVWDVASCAFPEGNHGSRIITTTEVEDVALACCSYQSEYMFKLEPLSDSQSKELFTSAVFGSAERHSRQLDELSDDILTRCAGLPQAIISISSVLASHAEANTAESWEQMQRNLPANTASEEILKQVLNFCYNSLPSCLQTCLLYLSIYPENYIILKEDIMKQWVAEGFVCAPTEKEKMIVAGSYFDKLVDMGLIQHIDVGYSNKVLYYAVHHMVHDLITSKSIEDNFITVVDYSQRTVRFSNKASRLSLQFGSATFATTPASTGLSQIRSLTFIGLMSCFPISILEFKLLRFLNLHIWSDQQPSTGVDLVVICELLLLRYLQVICNDIVHLPRQMQGLKLLETLEINARVAAIPLDIVHLRSLLHLRLGGGTELPDVTGTLTNVSLNPPSAAILLDESNSPPDSVKTIELLPPICRVPKWTGWLTKLCILKVVVRELLMDDTGKLQGLPSLTVLSLYVKQRTTEKIIFVTGAFAALEYFEFRCGVLHHLAFKEGAMPKLRKVKLGFNAHRGEWYGRLLVGIEHLSTVKEIVGIIGSTAGAEEKDMEAAESAFKDAICKHHGKISLKRGDVVEEEQYGPLLVGIEHLSNVQKIAGKIGSTAKKQQDLIAAEFAFKDTIGKHHSDASLKRGDIVEEEYDGPPENQHSVFQNKLMNFIEEKNKLMTVSVMGWFLSPHITELMKVAQDCAATNCMLYRGSMEKLAKLVQALKDIKRLLGPASTAIVNNQAKLDQLWQLKNDIHEVEEILDLFQLEINDVQLTGNYNLKHLDSKKVRLVKVLKSVGETRDRARELQHGAVPSILPRAETGPNPVRDDRSFFGYQDEYAQLASMLQKQPDGSKADNKMHRIIAIVGHAGMGKTELARQVFRGAKGKFDLCIWVHAYRKNTEYDLLKEIWKYVVGHKAVGEMEVRQLQIELKQLLASKRCLLVLDDVWNHELATSEVHRKHALVALDSFMGFAEDGSRVVLTTRAKICSATFRADASIILDGIKPKEITLLLDNIVKLRTNGIQELLNKQVPKLKGSPLAAVEIGHELRKQATSDKMCNILHNIEHHLGSVLEGHLFTYRHLPPHLQRCFEFCSIFPYNWRFEPEKLTKMWIALGFVEDTQQGPCMEDVARGYFHDLVDRSLFQEEGEALGIGTTYVIHEQIHWMIRMASTKNCISISSTGCHSTTPRRIPVTVRHLSVLSGCLDQLKAYPSSVLNNMRTLVVLKNDDDDSTTSTFDKGILNLFKGVRVLDLTATDLTHLPGTIHKLKHVRYLGLPSTIRNLCDEVTGLLFLQTFSLAGKKRNTCRLHRFPKHMNRLVNMRHLDIDMESIANISGIGRMAKLQGPIEFKAIRASEKEGHAVSELEGMNSLGETLSIKGLDAVDSKEEAMKAQLENKSAVKVLKLEWGPPDPRQLNRGPAAFDTATAVLEGLQPHHDLHELRITRYPGATSPTWLGVTMEKLVCLYLRNCTRLQALPAIGGLPCLELLVVKELPCVKSIDGGFCRVGTFPALKKVVLDDMPRLMAWSDMPELSFPRLREVSIIDCPRLSSLSGLERCTGPIDLRVKGSPNITPGILPAMFITGASKWKFH